MPIFALKRVFAPAGLPAPHTYYLRHATKDIAVPLNTSATHPRLYRCSQFCFYAERRWHPKLHHVLVEMEKGHLKDIDLPLSLRRSYSLQEVIQVRFGVEIMENKHLFKAEHA